MNTDLEPEFTTIVCLANSRKLSGRCLAGKVPETGVWFRPVSARPDAAINLGERRYDDGSEPGLLDVVDVPFTVARPSPFQPVAVASGRVGSRQDCQAARGPKASARAHRRQRGGARYRKRSCGVRSSIAYERTTTCSDACVPGMERSPGLAIWTSRPRPSSGTARTQRTTSIADPSPTCARDRQASRFASAYARRIIRGVG
jgi:hypothetical protein